MKRSLKVAITLLALCAPGSAHATQPLEVFLERSKTHSFDAREIEATRRQRSAEADAALGRLLPSFTARGSYTHNQIEVIANLPGGPGPLVIQPKNQFDAVLQLDVPIVDLSSYYQNRAANAAARATMEQELATHLDVGRAVSGAYYQFIGASALARSARESVALAEANEKNVEDRRSAGLATGLDRDRARANVERARKDVADADLLVALSARNLETLTGLSPEPSEAFPADTLREEAPLTQWLGQAGDTPQERATRESAIAAREARKAARAALLPTLSGAAQERFTNATGFQNRTSFYFLQLALTWRLDYATYAASKAEAAATEVALVRDERTRRQVSDSVFDAYHRVVANIAKSRASRAEADAARSAAELAADRYAAGAATQLDVTQAQRDAFLAEASRISADADLAFSRAALRLSVGKSPSDRRTP
jgi:outer membrane protein TolC